MKFLDPKNDLIFKKIFGEHPNILMSFLNAILPLSDSNKIESLEYLSPELVPPIPTEKFTTVDVRCKDFNGRQFIVEMQMNWTTAFKHRILFNASKTYVSQSKVGVFYDLLKPVYSVNLINDIYLPQTEEYYHLYNVAHWKDTKEILEGISFVLIELPKFKSLTHSDKRLQVLWLRFMTEINDSSKNIPSDLLQNKEIEEATHYLYETSLTGLERDLYEKSWDRISSERTLLLGAERKGISKGIEKGIEIGIEKGMEKGKIEERLEIAKNLKQMGISVEIIARSTGLLADDILKI